MKKLSVHLPGPTPDQVEYVQKVIDAAVIDPNDPRLHVRIGPAPRSEAELPPTWLADELKSVEGLPAPGEWETRVRELEAEVARLREAVAHYADAAMNEQLDATEAALAERDRADLEAMALHKALQSAVKAMERATLFITSKERIKGPQGDEWWEGEIAAARAALKPAEGEGA